MKIYDLLQLLDATAKTNGLKKMACSRHEHGVKKPSNYAKIQIRAVDEYGTVYRNTYKVKTEQGASK